MSVGENIKKLRKERKLTQQQLADKIGISRSYLGDIEKDRKSPSTKTLSTLAEKLGVSMFYLTTGDKALSDLTDEEYTAAKINFSDKFMEDVKRKEKELENRLRQLLDAELSIYEFGILDNTLEFLDNSDDYDMRQLLTILLLLNKNKDIYDKDNVSIEEIIKDIDDEAENFRSFLLKRYGINQ
ncbi:helix-turn-helix domain-containing protein [Salinicoccus roseus]|uniref:helix-turn-helix domain-containing protein n=1 Tax=Salinicoccus roseus TaxID=45670 RepID=UPI003566421E